MVSYRVRFARGENARYISHLDMVKVFERAIRRSGIPISYSHGFNPHPHMVFGLPPAVGITSDAEYADFELDEDIGTGAFIERLGKQLPAGFRIIAAAYNRQRGANIMSQVAGASYKILVDFKMKPDFEDLEKSINDFLAMDTIKAIKEGKKGPSEVDIKPMIISFGICGDKEPANEVAGNNEPVCFEALLAAGSRANLKPELLMNAFSDFLISRMPDVPYMVHDAVLEIISVHRTGLFIDEGGKMARPMDESGTEEGRDQGSDQ